MKKLLIALGLSSALLITPALAEDQPAGGTGATGDQSAPMKPKSHHHHHHKSTHAKSTSKKAPEAPAADPNAPKT